MIKILLFSLLSIALSIGSSSAIDEEFQFQQKPRQKAIQALKAFPSYFIENRRQLQSQVMYRFQMQNMNAYFSTGEIVYQFVQMEEQANTENQEFEPKRGVGDREVRVENIRMLFLGAEEEVKLEGLGEGETKVSYFRGNEERNWVRGLHTYEKVLLTDL